MIWLLSRAFYSLSIFFFISFYYFIAYRSLLVSRARCCLIDLAFLCSCSSMKYYFSFISLFSTYWDCLSWSLLWTLLAIWFLNPWESCFNWFCLFSWTVCWYCSPMGSPVLKHYWEYIRVMAAVEVNWELDSELAIMSLASWRVVSLIKWVTKRLSAPCFSKCYGSKYAAGNSRFSGVKSSSQNIALSTYSLFYSSYSCI